MRCRTCNAYIPEGATHCIECGTSTDPVLTCQKCGTEAPMNARFCRICGDPMRPPPDLPGRGPDPSVSRETLSGGTCPRCGSTVKAGVQYCPTCGTSQVAPEQTAIKSEPEPPLAESENTEALEPAVDVISCPKCGTIPRGEGRFCYNCGRFLQSDISETICPSCGATNTLRYSRCQYCGASMPKSK